MLKQVQQDGKDDLPNVRHTELVSVSHQAPLKQVLGDSWKRIKKLFENMKYHTPSK